MKILKIFKQQPVVLMVIILFFITGKSNLKAITLATEPVNIQLYGFIKMDAFYDNTEIAKGDWLLYVYPGNSKYSNTQVFSMNARSSRLGFKFSGPNLNEQITINSLVEVDFAGGFPNSSTAARQPLLRLRHAWVELYHQRWEMRMGQDWALISGPFPNTTNFVVGAGAGNLWMRYPQLKLTYKAKPLMLAASINRPMAGNIKYDDYASGDFDIVGDGERTGKPWWMGRLWFDLEKFSTSVSGHFGKENIADLSGTVHEKTSKSINLDAVLSIRNLTFTGRYFSGENLNSFFGGVFQGYTSDSTTVSNVRSTGGWAQIKYDISKTFSLAAGIGLDDPEDGDLKSGMRSINLWKYGNLTWSPAKAFAVMVELNQMETSYINNTTGKNLRLQVATSYKF